MAEHITRNDGGAGCRYGNKNRIGQTSIFIVYAVVAQSVEQLIRNYQTGLQKIEYATVAQSVEQLIRNQQVVCSSHITSSKRKDTLKSVSFLLRFYAAGRLPALRRTGAAIHKAVGAGSAPFNLQKANFFPFPLDKRERRLYNTARVQRQWVHQR